MVAFITSSGTLDKKNPHVREYLAVRADLIGAIRLPNNAFSDAGTSVTSDIIFLQKREHSLNALDPKPAWCYTAPVTVGKIGRKGQQPEQVEAQINNYYIQNPQMILGTMMQTSHYDMLTCVPVEGMKLSDQLDRAIHSLHAKIVIHRNEQAELARQSRIEPWGKDFTFQIQDGKVYYRIGSTMQEITDAKRGKVDTQVIRKLCELRDATRELLEKQQTKVTDEELIPLREKLNELYDAYFSVPIEESLRLSEKSVNDNDFLNGIRSELGDRSSLIILLDYAEELNIPSAPAPFRHCLLPGRSQSAHPAPQQPARRRVFPSGGSCSGSARCSGRFSEDTHSNFRALRAESHSRPS